jgi:hypothetical protein
MTVAKFRVVFEDTLAHGGEGIHTLAEIVMDALEDVDAEDPFVFADAANKLLRIEVVVEAPSRRNALAKGVALINSGLDTVDLESLAASVRAEDLVPA